MKRNILFTLLAAVGLMFTACSSTPPERVTYTIEMSEYAFKPDSIEVKVGQEVTLELVNMGQLVHELMIGRDVMMMQNRPNGYQTDMFESAGVEPIITSTEGEELDHEQTQGHEAGHTGYMVMLMENGGKATMTFTVTEDMVGEWEIGCFEQEGVHYEAGMVGKFVVAP
ncbi:MAG TPA: cupredoxin domain-containing protein [Anaerolineales bacterium]|nr:cupredoxin domain-containing protein [Anaerolineales bacterium]